MVLRISLIALSFFFQLSWANLDHDYLGCPLNSQCSKFTGETRAKWVNLINQWIKNPKTQLNINKSIATQTGHLINVWATPFTEKEPKLVLWDSPCSNHRIPGKNIYIAEIFVNSLAENEVKQHPEIIFSKAFYLEKNQIKSAYLPRGDAPIAIENNAFVFTKEEEGVFYGLTVGKDGKINVVLPHKPLKTPQEIRCPENLKLAFESDIKFKNLFQGSYCKALWDNQQNEFVPIILGWSCN